MHPRSFLEANPGAQQPNGPRPIGLRALWLIDPKGQEITANELICFLGAITYETPCEYQT